jgi:hypothetical protein
MHKTEGFEILLNGIPRSFRDQESVAYEAANLLKRRWPQEVVTILRPDGSIVTMQVDGRTK